MADAAPPSAPQALRSGSEVPPLLFDWRRRDIGRFRLFGFFLVSLLGHAVFFYLFKVVTPASARKLPPEESALFLNASQPAVAEILGGLEDRSSAVLVPGDQTESGAEELRAAIPAYQPTFFQYVPAAREPEPPGEPDLPGLAAAARPLLPPLEGLKPLTPAPVEPVAAAMNPQLLLHAPLSTRGLLTPPQWPKTLAAPEEADVVYSFHLGVDQAGLVRHCFVEGMAPPKELEAVVSRLRFQPANHAGLQWAEVEVHW